MPVFKKVNSDFFTQWGQEMGYVLGFIYADGYVHINKRGSSYLGFVSTDLQILREIRKALGSSHVISKRHRKTAKHHWKNLWRLQIGNKKILEDLRRIGVTQNKSLTLRLPSIPNDFLGHFLRGYFDGDGCVYFKKHKTKDRKNPRWIFQLKFISGSKKYLEDLHTKLSSHTCGGYIQEKYNRSGFELRYSHKDSLALYHLMYNNTAHSSLFLRRKYKLFTKAVTTLYKMQR